MNKCWNCEHEAHVGACAGCDTCGFGCTCFTAKATVQKERREVERLPKLKKPAHFVRITKLREILNRETSVIDPRDVEGLMRVIKREAD